MRACVVRVSWQPVTSWKIQGDSLPSVSSFWHAPAVSHARQRELCDSVPPTLIHLAASPGETQTANAGSVYILFIFFPRSLISFSFTRPYYQVSCGLMNMEISVI